MSAIPSNPITAGRITDYDTLGYFRDVTLSSDGNTAYVAALLNGLHVINLMTNDEFSSATDTVNIDVTPVNDPPTIGEIGNYVWYGNEFEDTTKTIFVEGVTAGSEEWFQPLRAYASTSNSELIVSPAVQFLPAIDVFPPEPYAISLTYTIKAGHSGVERH